MAVMTQHEAENLPACLESVAFADQTVVMDSGSTKDTIRIANDFGCEVFDKPWSDGFGAQKQYALDQYRHLWILALEDAPIDGSILLEHWELPSRC